MIEGLTNADLAKLEIGDILDTGVSPLEGLATGANLLATVVDVGKSGFVRFEVRYFGVLVGEYGAKANGGKTIWVDVMKARKERAK